MLTIDEILKATNGKIDKNYANIALSNVITDSRKAQKGDVFIPLIGDKFDGHDFIDNALSNGAYAVLSQKKLNFETDKTVIYVGDTLKALQQIAKFMRNKYHPKVVGITGSTGKTTTKEMAYHILSKKYNVLKTQGNFNNHIGLPLTLSTLNDTYDIAVLEMGMSNFGEIRRLKEIARPETAVYTNIGISHIENLKTRDNILKAKSEMIEDFDNTDYVILNADDDMLIKLKKVHKDANFLTYGVKSGDVRASNIISGKGLKFDVDIFGKKIKFQIDTYGQHNVYNALAAICVGLRYGIAPEDMPDALKEYKSDDLRLNIIKSGGIDIINDTYNASPDSVRAAVDVLCEVSSNRRKIAVIADMKELGTYSVKAHQDIGKYICEKGIDTLLCVGCLAKETASGALAQGMHKDCVFYAQNSKKAEEILDSLVKNDDFILVKGSRAMHMEEIVEYLRSGRGKNV